MCRLVKVGTIQPKRGKKMEMVFNGYSLTDFSITIYNDIIIINTKILTYNK